MLIKQILNNNVVSVSDANGGEYILTGRGLGFNASAGDIVDADKVEKTFRLSSHTVSDRFKVLLNEVPVEIIQLTDDIITQAQSSLSHQLSETLYVSLADHLHFALKRHQDGQEIHNPLEWEVRHFYRKEYLIGRQALALIASRTGQLLPDAEASSIALHLVNAAMNTPDGQVMEITRLIFQIQNIVKYWFTISIDDQSLNYQRFVTHLKFFAQRVMTGEILDNDDAELFDQMPKRYEKTMNCVQAIGDFVAKNYRHNMSNSEKLYLTVHIGNVISRQNNSI
ncbi:PRD domain-containing protein [Erwiniaceae bacterium BAC15a-03b]|uniref:PRD domain-containing protein n=1 Tax=Winslowiella arboricola TaxID=2978220 RepID=A0A9J6PUK2_9GAMM|nr:PRD domain-containing protein [Winslowiella arboricola]MCU5775261.1 PRD domain-containing protein [Winslowiella arboricola]MCU5780342.1 PRD domain-containing protein [Winslowiella arboricola]